MCPPAAALLRSEDWWLSPLRARGASEHASAEPELVRCLHAESEESAWSDYQPKKQHRRCETQCCDIRWNLVGSCGMPRDILWISKVQPSMESLRQSAPLALWVGSVSSDLWSARVTDRTSFFAVRKVQGRRSKVQGHADTCHWETGGGSRESARRALKLLQRTLKEIVQPWLNLPKAHDRFLQERDKVSWSSRRKKSRFHFRQATKDLGRFSQRVFCDIAGARSCKSGFFWMHVDRSFKMRLKLWAFATHGIGWSRPFWYLRVPSSGKRHQQPGVSTVEDRGLLGGTVSVWFCQLCCNVDHGTIRSLYKVVKFEDTEIFRQNLNSSNAHLIQMLFGCLISIEPF